MKLPFGLQIGRRKADVPTGTSGRDGDSWYNDVLAGGPDVNPELTGRAKYAHYQEMRLSDSAVKSALWMEKLPIRAGRHDYTPASEEPVDLLVRDACFAQLGMEGQPGWMDVGFNELLGQELNFLDWGAYFFEIIWGKDLVEFRDKDGDVHLLRPIVRLAPRAPATVDKVTVDPLTGKITELVQWLPGARPIPGDKLVHLALEPDPGNPFGTAMLRPMWGPWRLKKALMIAAGIGFDRHAAGIPKVRHPSGEKAAREAEDIGRNLRQHERAYVRVEGIVPSERNEGWDVELINGAATLADPTPLLHFYNYSIGEAALQQFSKLGTTERGARAVGEVLADPYYLAVSSIASYLAEQRSKQVLRRFVDHNFGPELDLPQPLVSKLQTRSLETIAAAMADLATAGIFFGDREVQNDIRDQFEFPHLPDDFPDNVGLHKLLPPGEGEGEGLPSATDDELARAAVEEKREGRMTVFFTGVEERLREFGDRLDRRREEPSVVNVNVPPIEIPAPQFDVHVPDPPDLAPLADAMRDLAEPPAPVVNVNVEPPAVQVDVAAPNVTVEAPNVTVEPQITVQPAEVKVDVPPAPPRKVRFRRGKDGKVDEATIDDG